jgi:hypothetical protein
MFIDGFKSVAIPFEPAETDLPVSSRISINQNLSAMEVNLMKHVKHVAPAIGLLTLAACAPTVWDRPYTSAGEFNADDARCRLTARAMNRDDFEAHGRIGFVIAASLIHGIAQGAATQQDYSDCMQANGYTPRAPGAIPVAAVSIAPPPVAPPTTAVGPRATVAPPVPSGTAVYLPPVQDEPGVTHLSPTHTVVR